MRTLLLSVAIAVVTVPAAARAESLRDALDLHLVPRSLAVGVALHGAPGYSSTDAGTLAFGGSLALSSYDADVVCGPPTGESTIDRLARYKRRFVDRAPRPCDARVAHHGALAWRLSIDYEARAGEAWSHAVRASVLRGVAGSDLALGVGVGPVVRGSDLGLTAQLDAAYDLRTLWRVAWPRLAAFAAVRLDSVPDVGAAGVVGLRLSLDTPRR